LQLTISQSVCLGLEPLCDSWPDLCWSYTIIGLMSWGVFPGGRTGLSSLLDLLLESSSLDPTWSLLCSLSLFSRVLHILPIPSTSIWSP